MDFISTIRIAVDHVILRSNVKIKKSFIYLIWQSQTAFGIHMELGILFASFPCTNR